MRCGLAWDRTRKAGSPPHCETRAGGRQEPGSGGMRHDQHGAVSLEQHCAAHTVCDDGGPVLARCRTDHGELCLPLLGGGGDPRPGSPSTTLISTRTFPIASSTVERSWSPAAGVSATATMRWAASLKTGQPRTTSTAVVPLSDAPVASRMRSACFLARDQNRARRLVDHLYCHRAEQRVTSHSTLPGAASDSSRVTRGTTGTGGQGSWSSAPSTRSRYDPSMT